MLRSLTRGLFPRHRAPQASAARGFRLYQAATLAGLALLLAPLPGCQSVTGNPSLSQVRIVDASPDAPGLDIYQGSTPLAYNLGLGTITSYVPITPGTYGIFIDSAGTRQQIVAANGTFATGAQYTVLVGNYSNTLQETILKDQSQPAPSGQIDLRFLDQSTRAGAVDLYLVPSGSTIASVSPILKDVTFGSNSGYLSIVAGTYTLYVVPTGTVVTATTATSYTGAAVTYSAGTAKTFILIDQQLVTTPGLQVVIANDYDSASAG